MQRFRWMLVGALACAALHPAVAISMATSAMEEVPVDAVGATRALIHRADALNAAKDSSAALKVVVSAIESEGFAKLSTAEQHIVLAVGGSMAVEQGQAERGLDWLKRATQFDEATARNWHERLSAAFQLRNYPDSALCIATIAKRWPNLMDQIPAPVIYALDRELKYAHASASRRELLQALFDAAWKDDGNPPSSMLIDLSLMMIADGDLKRAASVIARIDAPRSAVILRADRRFDRSLRAAKQKIDVEQIAAAAVARARERVEAAPTLLAPRVALQSALLQVMKYDEVLAIADDVIARTREVDGATVFTDFKDKYIWLLNHRSHALQSLGRFDEAIEQMKKAARRPEGGDLNVSQAINLGLMLASMNRPGEAREAIAELGGVSEYGRALTELVGLMAAAQDHDSAAVDKHLAYLSEHRTTLPSIYGIALLELDRLDDAANLLIERLRRDDWRSEALQAMQIYADQPQPPRATILSARWRAVIARPDVQAELAKVGRIERFNLASHD
ncbi:MAG: hypothetical protein ABI411_07550 [Tahibacter sp.]